MSHSASWHRERDDRNKLADFFRRFPEDADWNPIEPTTLQEIGFHGEPIKAESEVSMIAQDDIAQYEPMPNEYHAEQLRKGRELRLKREALEDLRNRNREPITGNDMVIVNNLRRLGLLIEERVAGCDRVMLFNGRTWITDPVQVRQELLRAAVSKVEKNAEAWR